MKEWERGRGGREAGVGERMGWEHLYLEPGCIRSPFGDLLLLLLQFFFHVVESFEFVLQNGHRQATDLKMRDDRVELECEQRER